MEKNLKNLIKSIAEEVDQERENKLSLDERKLHAFCQSLLLMEREMNAPGAGRTQEDRVTRILAELEKAKI